MFYGTSTLIVPAQLTTITPPPSWLLLFSRSLKDKMSTAYLQNNKYSNHCFPIMLERQRLGLLTLIKIKYIYIIKISKT